MDTSLSNGSTDDGVDHGIVAIAMTIGATRRRAQHLHETRQIPTFKLGKVVCMRRKAWRDHVARLEREAAIE